MADKIPEVIESVKDNDGKHTIIRTTLEAGATVPPHYHTLFDETFEVIEGGEINVWNGDTERTLKVRQSGTIKKNTVHHYQVGANGTVVKITLEPGNLNFENAMRIITGTQADNAYSQLSTVDKDNLTFMAVIADLTNSNYVGETGAVLENLLQSDGKQVEQVKNDLVTKYCN
jgi:quercetin dioxygenase-like cupin family protein